MNILETWRTVIVAGLTMLTGIGLKFGLVFPEGFVIDTANTLIALGAVFGGLRMVTTKKVGSQPIVKR